MNYRQVFSDHPIHSTISEIEKQIDKVVWDYPEYKGVDELVKTKFCVDYIKKLLSSANPFITAMGTLDNINSHLANAKSHLNTFLQNTATGLANVTASLDAALTYTNQIISKSPSGKNAVEVDSIEIFEKLQRSMEASINYYTKKEAEFEQKAKAMLQQIATAQSSLESVTLRVDGYLTNLQTSFNTSESDRLTQSQAAIAQVKSELTKLSSNQTEDYKKLKASLIAQGDDVISDLEDKKDKASKLLQIITTTGFAGNYSKNADAEKQSADRMRWVSITIFAVISLFAIYILFTFESNSSNWQNTLVKILASSLLTALATYTARESSKHRKLEQKYRKMELELSSLDAFIETLPEAERNAIKIEITKRLFSQEESATDTQKKETEEEMVPTSLFQNTMKIIEEAMKNLTKK